MKQYRTNEKKLEGTLLLISRIIIGVVFIFSGFVKAVDPLGYTYKLNDYFTAFGTHWATHLSFALSIIVSAAEFIVGVAVLLNFKVKYSSLGALIFMIIFTPLTLYLAIANPVHDCGCFGDAWVITNWETFFKNLALSIPVVYLFINRKKSYNRLSDAEQWGGAVVSAIFIVALSWYSYNHLPVLDFRPYKVGTYIPDEMEIPEGAKADVWESTFVYSKNGQEKEFGINDLPDSTWTFMDAKHTLVEKGYEPPIHDFTIRAPDGADITDMVLASDNYHFLMIAYDLAETNQQNIDGFNRIAEYSFQKGYPFYCLTASTNEQIEEFRANTGATYDFYSTDEITLKTIIRSNPGLVLLKEGTIIDKWHWRDIPDTDQLSESLIHQSIKKYKAQADKYYILTLILAAGFIVVLYLLLQKSGSKK